MKKFTYLFLITVQFILFFCCKDESNDNISRDFSKIAGTYNLIELTTNYPIDYNANGNFTNNIFPFVSNQSCISSIIIFKDGRVIWNDLDFFGGIGADSNCQVVSKKPTTCRINDGVNGATYQRYGIIKQQADQLTLVDAFDDQFSWQIINDKIMFKNVKHMSVAFLFEGNEYPPYFGCSPGEGIYLTYTFQKQL